VRLTLSLAAVLSVCLVQVDAEPKDPKSPAVPADKASEAKELIRQLDDDDVDVRDKASAALQKLGRLAFPAMQATMNGKPSAEVRSRLEQLIPAARKADFDVRYPLFLADTDGKQDHDLLGWNELKATAGDTKESRRLFADILADELLRASLLIATSTSQADRKMFDGRWQVKWKSWFGNAYKPPENEAFTFVAACWLQDLISTQESAGQARAAVVRQYLDHTKEGKLVLRGKGTYGNAPLLLLKEWIGTRQGYIDLQTAWIWARDFKFGEDAEVKALTRMADWSLEHGTGYADAIGQLTMMKNPAHISILKRFFDSTIVGYPALDNGGRGEVQWRDMALAMSLVLVDQDPAEFGFAMQSTPSAELFARANPQNYYFKDGDGKTADDKRKAAFKKWAEWEKANPEKIKAKPPEKK
jgi:hypothetical protein